MPDIWRIPGHRSGQTRSPQWPALTALLIGLTALVPLPSSGQSSTDPLLVSVAGPVDEAWTHASISPLTIRDLETAEQLLRQADQILGPALGTAQPAPWARERGYDSLLLIELFNRFNETADLVEDARRFKNTVVWSLDPQTGAYLDGKGKRLAAAKRALPKDRFALYLGHGRDGDAPAAVKRPWQTLTGPRYGFDVGRFRREETVDLGADGSVRVERHVVPVPWKGPASRTGAGVDRDLTPRPPLHAWRGGARTGWLPDTVLAGDR